MRDRAAKAAYDRARYARLRVDSRPERCERCGGPNRQPAHGWRKFCSTRCRRGAFTAAHPGYRYVPVPPVEPMPMAYVGHPVFEEATRAAGLTGASYSVDWGQYDILGEAVLAILEGRDPKRAVSKQRAAMRGIERSTTRSYADLGRDDEGNIYAVKDYDGD